MVHTLLRYPDPSIRLISGNVRFFDDELRGWIADMIDTMKANELQALSAIMIGIQYNIIVLKEGDRYLPYINGRIIKHSGKTTATERSTYYEGISVDVERYDKVTALYDDIDGSACHRDFEGEEARVFQHQLDYCFGSTFVDRVDREMKRRINDHLEFGLVKDSSGGACPTVFYRDYFKRAAKYLLGLIALTFLVPFFGSDEIVRTTAAADRYALAAVPLLTIGYGMYALYESRQYKQCTSCQTGNIIGTVVILAGQFIVVLAGVVVWMK